MLQAMFPRLGSKNIIMSQSYTMLHCLDDRLPAWLVRSYSICSCLDIVRVVQLARLSCGQLYLEIAYTCRAVWDSCATRDFTMAPCIAQVGARLESAC